MPGLVDPYTILASTLSSIGSHWRTGSSNLCLHRLLLRGEIKGDRALIREISWKVISVIQA